jgi:hypothetical protein
MNCVRTLILAAGLLAASPLGMLAVTPAFAQARDLDKAKDAYRAGKEAYDSNDFVTAAERFVESFQYSGRDELLFNIGQAFRQGGKLVEAERYFQQYLQAKPEAANADDVVNYVIEIQQQIAAEYGTLVFESSAGSSILIAGAKAPCKTPCTVTLPAGSVKYTASAEGQIDISGSVDVEQSKTKNVKVEFEAITVQGFVRLESDRPARVSVDGVAIGELPMSDAIILTPGTHRIELKDGNASWSGDVDINRDETLRMMVPLNGVGGTSWKRITAYVLGGTGVALAIGGVAMGLEASSTVDTLDVQERLRGFADQDLVDQGESQALTANILYAASALVIGTGVGLYVWDIMDSSDDGVAPPSEDAEPSVEEAPAEEAPAEPAPAPESNPDEELLF